MCGHMIISLSRTHETVALSEGVSVQVRLLFRDREVYLEKCRLGEVSLCLNQGS